MSYTEKLFESKWLSVIKKTMQNGSSYIYSSADWCGSNGVAILPYRVPKNGFLGDFEYLGRLEICPAHSDVIELCSITGGMDKEGEQAITTAWRELIEEGGYEVPIENIIRLGTVRPSKASESTMHLFAVDVDMGGKVVEAVGDGTLGEEGAFCEWVTKEQLIFAKDPLLHTMIQRLEHRNRYAKQI